jgi:hypothetical protein
MGAGVVLQSWKEISAYVGRTERTLQRWETQFGFPVHRPSGKSRSSVMALSQEIQEWTRGKPSLVSIRESGRLTAAIVPIDAGRQHLSENHLLQSSQNDPSPSQSQQLANSKILQDAALEHLQLSRLLWEEQKTLRTDIRDLLLTQRKLREELRQNLLPGRVEPQP